MLREAAQLTLGLATAALECGLELKDATPRNVLFKGSRPVFIDLLSFQEFRGIPVWQAYNQFVSSFLLPLLLHTDLGLRLDRCYLPDREGLDLKEGARLLGFAKGLRKPYRSLVTLPNLLGRLGLSLKVPELDRDTARTICLRRLQGLKGMVDACAPPRTASTWTGYACDRTYSEQSLAEKSEQVAKVLADLPPGSWVLDLGANTGEFTWLAAGRGHSVVAVDSDEPCLDRLYRKASAESADVLPVVMNLGRPTPACGWDLAEQPSFLSRAEGRFDLVLALALVHHLRFVEGVPFHRQVRALQRLSARFVLVEWVEPWDPQVRGFVDRFGYLPDDFSREAFERCLPEEMPIRDCRELHGGTRWLYLLENLGPRAS